MKIFCCYTPAHEILFQQHFLPSVPEGFMVEATKLDIAGKGDFLSAEFLNCIGEKIRRVIASVKQHDGEIIVWSDIDIRFFSVEPRELVAALGEHDLAFQREGKRVTDVNAGFIICRCNSRVEGFLEQVKEGLIRDPSLNEQAVINQMLKENPARISWIYLPWSFYARTHGWPPPRDLSLYHANATPGKDGVGQKMRQFREVAFLRRYGLPALLLTSAKYVPKRLWRLASERLSAH